MDSKVFDVEGIDIQWCPGCGNFSILKILKQTFAEMELKPEEIIIISGIGQAAKTPHYLKVNCVHSLHGRALPIATSIKAVNPNLVVIAEGGDGDMYAEGGNHFIHTIRRNPNITNIVHNNMVYGLTKGQASPTSQIGFKTPVQVEGVFEEPFNPIAVAIALDASFVARAFVGDQDKAIEILKKAIQHKGYALVDLFQPCPSFNKVNTYQWFKEHTYYLDDTYDPTNRIEAFRRATEQNKFPLGILYLNPNKASFEENLNVYRENKEPLYKRELSIEKLASFLDARKSN